MSGGRFSSRAARRGGRSASAGMLGLWLAIAVLGLLVLVAPAWHRPDDDLLHLPVGYTNRVAALIRQGFLTLRPDGSYEPDAATLKGADPQLGDAIAKFRAASFLDRDLARGSGTLWTKDGIDPNAHRENGPTDNIGGWKGDLRFRRFAQVLDPARGDPGPELELIDIANDVRWIVSPGATGSLDDQQIDLLARKREGGGSARRILFVGPARQMAPLELLLIGDQPVLFLRGVGGGGQAATIRVDGEILPGTAAGNFGERLVPIALRRPGSNAKIAVDLDIAPPGYRAQHFRLMEHLPVISSYQPGGTLAGTAGKRMATLRRAYPGLESFAAPIEARMTKGDLETTLIEELQSPAQRLLASNAEAVLRQRGRRAFSFRASAALMDGMTGEIVALPTWPTASGDLLPSDQGDPTSTRLFEANNNFVNQPIGSTAKIPFAAAITQRFPELLRLRLSSDQSPNGFTCVMGWPKRTFTGDPDVGHNLSFPQFIARSSNRYAMSLMMLGLADPGVKQPYPTQQAADWRPLCPDEHDVSVDGVPFRAHPSYGLWDKAISRDVPVAVAGPWADNLAKLFCVKANGDSILGTNCASDLWGRGTPLAGKKVLEIAPVDLGFNQVRDLYSDYLMAVLGGARSRWSTIQLAQAYARVVSLLRVQPTLTPVPPKTIVPPLPLRPDVRSALLEGMTHVFDASAEWAGTAKTFMNFFPNYIGGRRPLADGSVIRFYGKTGTPAVAPFRAQSENSKLLTEFAGANCLHGTTLSSGAGGRADIGMPGQRPIDAVRSLPEGRCKAIAMRDPAGLASEIAAVNRAPGLIRVGSDGLVRDPPKRGVPVSDTEPTGKLFVFVAARYPNAATTTPCSVSVIASNFQSEQAASPALLFTKQLLGETAVKRWILRAQKGCRRLDP